MLVFLRFQRWRLGLFLFRRLSKSSLRRAFCPAREKRCQNSKMRFGGPFGHFLTIFCCFFCARQARKYCHLQWFCAFGMKKVLLATCRKLRILWFWAYTAPKTSVTTTAANKNNQRHLQQPRQQQQPQQQTRTTATITITLRTTQPRTTATITLTFRTTPTTIPATPPTTTAATSQATATATARVAPRRGRFSSKVVAAWKQACQMTAPWRLRYGGN